MHVIRRPGWQMPERLATSEHLFFNRRALLAAVSAVGATTALRDLSAERAALAALR
jgi:hypothetical protein